jgi:hypothetical protein
MFKTWNKTHGIFSRKSYGMAPLMCYGTQVVDAWHEHPIGTICYLNSSLCYGLE